jgi:hypothetical protein
MVVLFTYGLNYQSTAKHTGEVRKYVGISAERELLLRSIFLQIKIIPYENHRWLIMIMFPSKKRVNPRSSNIL